MELSDIAKKRFGAAHLIPFQRMFTVHFIECCVKLGCKMFTLSCSATDNALCKDSMIQRCVLCAYILAASVTDMISAIPLRNINISPRSLDGYWIGKRKKQL